jgi:hypothetical protein
VDNLWISFWEIQQTCGKALVPFNSIRLLKSKLSPRVINDLIPLGVQDSKVFLKTAFDNLTEIGNWA